MRVKIIKAGMWYAGLEGQVFDVERYSVGCYKVSGSSATFINIDDCIELDIKECVVSLINSVQYHRDGNLIELDKISTQLNNLYSLATKQE